MTAHRTHPLLFVLLLFVLCGCCEDGAERGRDPVIDEASVLSDVAGSLDTHLRYIRDNYSIEVVLATVETTGDDETLREMAVRLFSEWDVGRRHGGKGLLILLADREKAVRIEVGSVLEHVYTDLFTGQIEDRQLPSYYVSGQLEIGLIALVEEIELRAQLMSRDEADMATIAERDRVFLSGGGGADVVLGSAAQVDPVPADREYPAGDTPEEAWQTLIRSWRDRNRNYNIGVYTPATRLLYRAFTSRPDRAFDDDVRTWGEKPYEVISDGDYAVIFFGKKKGWDNAPFLFCRTDEGWQFDMVYQRKIIRMGRTPTWGIERWEHPYIELLARCPFWMGQDMPLPADDRYDVSRDAETVTQILEYERRYEAGDRGFDTLFTLGTLYSRTSMGQQRITLLGEALQLRPNHLGALAQLAVCHVDAHYQYEQALELMERYISLQPDDTFGNLFHGYLLLMLDQPKAAIRSFEKGLAHDPKNIYGLCKLARAHLEIDDVSHRTEAKSILARLEKIVPGHIRVEWLRRKLGG